MAANGSANAQSFVMTQIGADRFLDDASDLDYGPDDYLWVSERDLGQLVRIDPETGARDNLIKISAVYSEGRQTGLLGFTFHPDFAGGMPYVYLSYTFRPGADLYQRIVRYTFDEDGTNGFLLDPLTLIDSLPASNDHNSGRLIFGPDGKLFYTIGDQGGNQGRNYCNQILSQVLPTQMEVDARNWAHYPGKVLRINTDGSIPDDNPVINGVRSHVYSYGHRNAQGLLFGSNGLLYSSEHGPDTDDELNVISGGMNYGWPRVVGFQDDQAYDYCDWSTATDCATLTYDKFSCPDGATFLEENTLTDTNYRDPLFAMFAVADDYDYNDPRCSDSWMCRPNVAPSSLGIYEGDGIPGWDNSLLVTSLKRGRVYRLQLDESGARIVGDTTQHFYTSNRYRDIAAGPDGKSFYIITDPSGNTSDASGVNRSSGLANPGTILKFSLDESTSTNVVGAETSLRVWPNPATDELYVELDAAVTASSRAELINVKGQVISLRQNLAAGVNQLPLGSLPAGVYTLKVFVDGGFMVRRVVVR